MFRILLCLLTCCATLVSKETIILVSVPSYTKIVQELVGQEATVVSIVPPGISFHTFEPSPKDTKTLLSATLWFTIGDPFEERIFKKLEFQNETIKTVDLREGIPLIYTACCHAGADPHIWLSPHLMKQQIQTIVSALKNTFPNISIQKRSEILLERIQNLETVFNTLLNHPGGTVVVAHGAFAYLCRDYGIEQLSIEHEGKEPTFASFTSLIEKASKKGVKTVFSLKQYPKKGIQRVADIINAQIIELDPYAGNYFESMQYIAEQFHRAIQEEHE
jgi:zinc transport system substrate-binding protein